VVQPVGRAFLAQALGASPELPTPDELGRLLARAEVQLLLGHDSETHGALEDVAWYLHAVASAWRAVDIYPIERRRQAFQLSAHIFDLLLGKPWLSRLDRLRMSFAAQVGFLQSSQDPNAIAIYRRRHRLYRSPDVVADSATASLEFGSALLGSDSPWLYRTAPLIEEQILRLEETWQLSVLDSPFASEVLVSRGVAAVLDFLVRGSRERLREAATLFRAAIASESAWLDIDSRLGCDSPVEAPR
jgi:hypothetical protein